MRRVKRLIKAARRLSENDETVTTTVGISDEEFVQYMNDGQDSIMSELERIDHKDFTREAFITTVAGTEAYNLPSDIYLGTNIVAAEYSFTGNSQDFRHMRRITLNERDTSEVGLHPFQYILRNKQILLNPVPTTGRTNGLRLSYVKNMLRLDKRRAILTAATNTSTQVTALTVDLTDFTDYFPDASAFSDSSILEDDLFTLVDASGVVQARGIPITAISTSTGVATVGSYTADDADTGGAIGDYLLAGERATTHSELEDRLEAPLITYTAWRITARDSSEDGQILYQEFLRQLEDVKAAWRKNVEDVDFIPIIQDRYIWT